MDQALESGQEGLAPEDVRTLDRKRAERASVVQGNALLRGSQPITMNAKRLLVTAMIMVERSDHALKRTRMYVSDFRRLWGIESNGAARLMENAAENLMQNHVLIDRGRGSWSRLQILNASHFTNGPASEDGRAYMEVVLHDDLKPLLLELVGDFTDIPVLVYRQLSSMYTTRVLETLTGYAKGREKCVLDFELEDFKKRVGAPKSYRYADLRRRVLEPTKDEADSLKPRWLTFRWKPVTEGRAVRSVRFFVEMEDHADLVQADEMLDVMTLRNLVQSLGFRGNIRRLADSVGGVDAAIKLAKEVRQEVKARESTGKPIVNPGGYLREVFRNAGSGEFPEDADELERPKKAGERLSRQAMLDHVEALLTAFERARGEHADAVFEGLPEGVKADLSVELYDGLQQGQLFVLDERGKQAIWRTRRDDRLEELGHLRYEGDLKDPRAYGHGTDYGPDLPEDQRQAIFDLALQQYEERLAATDHPSDEAAIDA